MDIAKEMSKSLSEGIIIAKVRQFFYSSQSRPYDVFFFVNQVDGTLWDLERPLEKSCKLELINFEHPEGKKVFSHSSAHFWEKHLNVTMAAICVWVLLRMMVSATR